MIRVFLLDNNTAIRQGLKMRLALESDLIVVGEAGNAPQAILRVPASRPDVIVMSVETPDIAGQLIRELLSLLPACEIILLSLHDNLGMKARALAAGATAFVSKHDPFDMLLTTIRQTGKSTHEANREEPSPGVE